MTTSGAKLRPSAKLAVLGLVLQRPSWGYELVARFDRAFAEQQPWPWRVTPQAIYGALNDLEAVELIERIEPEGEPRTLSAQRNARQHWRATAGGARAMREWLAAPMLSNPTREEVLIRLHFGADDASLRAMLQLHAAECLEELERIGATPALTRPERLVKEDRRLAVQARLSWIDFALAELRGPDDARIRPGER
ncbi:MAG TPA: PadR family transcriptional regulator [Gemmatimonadaceae bacterium]|nr:PadR family transcriptional regulator [Gemmatimonadaceae bacterium]